MIFSGIHVSSMIQASFLALILVPNILTAGHKYHDQSSHETHQQIHLSLGIDSTEMIVTWVTLEACPGSFVEYGSSEMHLSHNIKAVQTEFNQNASFFTHRALLGNLNPDSVYYYRVGNRKGVGEENFSEVFSFHTMSTKNDWNPKLLVYGDLGHKNDVSLPFLRNEFQHYDAIFHIGDFAYDLHDDFGVKGDKFMRDLQPIAAKIPYMTCSGNHEKHDNFSHYDARFSMLGDRQKPEVMKPINERLNNHYYSLDIGPAHIVVISTEFYYFYDKYGWQQIEYQYEWLKNDLELANKNREKTPWIIVMGHRPFYTVKACEQPECDSNNLERPAIRQGIALDSNTKELRFGLEKLFYEMGVDIHISGHEHLYARMLPMYNFTVRSGKDPLNPYHDPMAPITIITGSAGNKEEHPEDRPSGAASTLAWVAHRHTDYGYTRLNFIDSHHISVEQTSDEQGGKVVDRFDIIKSDNKPKWIA